LALFLERMDTSIRTRAAAEREFGNPVLAEVGDLLPGTGLSGRQLDARNSDRFRLLAAQIASNGSRTLATRGDRTALSILVTSPGPEEGKTTIAALLANALAEIGRKVLVVSADLRDPEIDRLFSVTSSPGLTDALESQDQDPLGQRVVTTDVPGLELLPSGEATDRPTQLLASPRMGKVFAQARARADAVIIDSSPILASGDAVLLLNHADLILVVARSGVTNAEAAGSTSQILDRMGSSRWGVILNGVKSADATGTI
ncbi:MAG: CpsD/CapB family tyrosine-protein kinase, partial [Acidimicrobiia bacterium]